MCIRDSAGSLRSRRSTGSMPRAHASSSMADSRAYIPGHSPGARIQEGLGTSRATTRCAVLLCGEAYMTRAGTAACSTNSLIREVCVATSWDTARSTPSRSAPRRTRCTVGARCPTSAGMWRRGTETWTGRPVWRAAMAARTTWGRGVPLEPKPPPTCSEWTVMSSGPSPSTWARPSRTVVEPWLESWTVRCPSAQSALDACGSMGWLCSPPRV